VGHLHALRLAGPSGKAKPLLNDPHIRRQVHFLSIAEFYLSIRTQVPENASYNEASNEAVCGGECSAMNGIQK
jgi:hypothetical protein